MKLSISALILLAAPLLAVAREPIAEGFYSGVQKGCPDCAHAGCKTKMSLHK